MSTWMMACTASAAVSVVGAGPGFRAPYSCDRRANARVPGVAVMWVISQTRVVAWNLYVANRPNAYSLKNRCRWRMNTTTHAIAAVLTVTTALSAGCAERGVKEMVTIPESRQTEGAASERRALVMFRVAMELDGQVVDAPFSAFHSM